MVSRAWNELTGELAVVAVGPAQQGETRAGVRLLLVSNALCVRVRMCIDSPAVC